MPVCVLPDCEFWFLPGRSIDYQSWLHSHAFESRYCYARIERIQNIECGRHFQVAILLFFLCLFHKSMRLSAGMTPPSTTSSTSQKETEVITSLPTPILELKHQFGLLIFSCAVYIPCLYVMNKIDTITIEELDLLSEVPHYVPICAGREWNFDQLLESIWSYLNMLRMYASLLLIWRV